jgi:hypothetical protein
MRDSRPARFTSRWYLTLFTDLPEWSHVLRLWDLIVYL